MDAAEPLEKSGTAAVNANDVTAIGSSDPVEILRAGFEEVYLGEDEVLTYDFDSDGIVVVRISNFFAGPGMFSLTVDAS